MLSVAYSSLEAKLTAPITGPYTKSEFLYDIPAWDTGTKVYKTYKLERTWYRQHKPYTLPLQFDSRTRRAKSVRSSTGPYGTWYGSWTDAIAVSPDFPEQDPNIYNQAYARFVNAWKESVELGVATAEGREALSMMTSRLVQMGNFTRHLARGNVGLAAADLGIYRRGSSRKGTDRLPPRIRAMISGHEASNTRRDVARGFSSLYLEFHFGWAPLVNDIHDAMKVLDKPFKTFRARGSATGVIPDRSAIPTHNWEDTDWRYSETREGSYKQRVMVQGDVVITNPNLAMMQQLGILNPAVIAWELVPFSFVLDWFVNVGDYLGSLTDFAGVELQNAHRTIFTRYSGNYKKTSLPKQPNSNQTVSETWEASTVYCFRRLGIGTGPTIRPRTPKPWGIRRGLAAASLLLQRFPKHVIDENAITLAKKRTDFRVNVFPQFNGKYW